MPGLTHRSAVAPVYLVVNLRSVELNLALF
jgi:hypothetical protein